MELPSFIVIIFVRQVGKLVTRSADFPPLALANTQSATDTAATTAGASASGAFPAEAHGLEASVLHEKSFSVPPAVNDALIASADVLVQVRNGFHA